MLFKDLFSLVFLYGDHNKKSATGSIALSLTLWLIRLLWLSYSITDLICSMILSAFIVP